MHPQAKFDLPRIVFGGSHPAEGARTVEIQVGDGRIRRLEMVQDVGHQGGEGNADSLCRPDFLGKCHV